MSAEAAAAGEGKAPAPDVVVAGDRGAARFLRGASLQAKVQNALALGVVLLLGGGFLAWYYARLSAEPAPAAEQSRAKAAARGEMKLPPLGPAPPAMHETRPDESSRLIDADSAEGKALLAGVGEPAGPQAYPDAAGGTGAAVPPPVDPVLQRRLGSPVLIRGTGSYSGAPDSGHGGQAEVGGTVTMTDSGSPLQDAEYTRKPGAVRPESAGLARGTDAGSEMGGLLRPTRTAAVAAATMPDRRFLLPKGAFIDCTLETAIDSTLPGMTTCITATDVWSADGSVVLLDRGTKLVGETRGGVQQGQQRLFVLWSEARSPAGVVVELASPGTDELGRSGVTGDVDTHFAARFGAAILISVIDAGTAALVASQSNGSSSVVIAPQGASDVAAEVLKQTVAIPPTIRVDQGSRMQVLVARDVSFATVYALARR